MAFQERIEAANDGAETDQSVPSSNSTTRSRFSDDPFSMQYETEQFEMDADTVDQMLSLLVAATNVL